MELEVGALLKEGKGKKIFATNDPEIAVVHFKDETIAFHGLKRGRILGKGEVNNAICRHVFEILSRNGVENHYIRQISPRECAVWQLDVIPVAVKVRNIVAGSLAQRIGYPTGTLLDEPVVECELKDGDLEFPLINFSHIVAMKLATHA